MSLVQLVASFRKITEFYRDRSYVPDSGRAGASVVLLAGGDVVPGIRMEQDLVVAEVNLHTSQGNAPPAIREPLAAGAISATALAKRLLQAVDAGVTRQAAYTMAGF